MKDKREINIISINNSIPKVIEPCFRNEDRTTMVSTEYNGHHNHDTDPRLVYKVNDHGHHGDDFFNNPDILAIGCSVTAGLGLPHDMTWPHLVARESKQTVNVIGIPGAGAEQILHNALLHMQKFGKPKKIMALIPNLQRAWMPMLESNGSYSIIPLQWDFKIKEYLKLSKPITYKDWYGIKRSIPSELIIKNALVSIENFKIICDLLDIEFSYYSWDILYTNNTFNKIKESNTEHEKNCDNLDFFQADYNFEKYDNKICHHSENKEHDPFWVRALDHPMKHPGMHAHIHYAEMFLEEKLSQETIDKSKTK